MCITNGVPSLSEKFQRFVTLKLANRRHNIQCKRKSKSKSKSNTGTDSVFDLDYQSSSEELQNPDDDDSNIVFEENYNSDPEELTLEPSELHLDNDSHHSPDCTDMTPNIAPTAPMLANRGFMGNTSSKLNDPEARYSHPDLVEYRKQHESSDNNVTRDSYSAGAYIPDTSTTIAAAAESSNNTNNHKRTTRKRPVGAGTAEPGKKRNKFTPNVYGIKPRLIVILPVRVPLTQEKGASTRTRTEPTRQPRIHAPASELEEIVTGPSAPPVQPPFDITDDIPRTRPDLHQPASYRQNATGDPKTSGRNPGDSAGEVSPTQSRDTNATLPFTGEKSAQPISQRSHAVSTHEELEAMARIREKYLISKDQVSDEFLSAALKVISVQTLVTKILMPYQLRMPDPLPAQAIQDERTPDVDHATAQNGVVDGHSTHEKRGTAGDGSNDGPANTQLRKSSEVVDSSDELVSLDVPMSKDVNQVAGDNLQPTSGQALLPHTARNDLSDQEHPLEAETTEEQNEARVTPGAPIKQTTEAQSIAPQAAERSNKASAGDLDSLLGRIYVLLRPKREDGTELPVAWITLCDACNNENFFQAAHEALEGELQADEQLAKVHVTQTSGTPLDHMKTGFSIVRGCRKNKSWEKLPFNVQAAYKRDMSGFYLEMAADLFVKRKVDEKL